jgi:hypothetical protein
MRIILVCLVGVVVLWGSDPIVTPELKAQYWRAQAETLALQLQIERKKMDLQSIIAEIKKSCRNWTLGADDKGEPICVKPKNPEAKK